MKKIFDYLVAGAVGAVVSTVCFYLMFKVVDNIEGERVSVYSETTDGDVEIVQTSLGVSGGSYLGLCPDFVSAAETTVNAVVHIKSQMVRKSGSFDLFFGDQIYLRPNTKMYSSTGSGVVITSNGYIVTNYHVVDGADLITVTLNDNSSYEANVVGIDPSTDLAVIKIKEENLPYLEFANSNDVKVGEWVLAVGNPFNLTSTVTAGIVSAKARNINILPNGSIESFIQTDAAVNRGNSGGALVNIGGELVGINAAIASETGSFSGYSFAIPSNIVKKVAADIIRYGEVHRAYIGINVLELNGENNEQVGVDLKNGLFVTDILHNGSAYFADIKRGDVIVSIAGVNTSTFSKLQEVIGQYNPGDELIVEIVRDDKREFLTVKLRDKYGRTSFK